MTDFDKSINENRFEVDNLFRAYKLNGKEDIDKIRAGFDEYGEAFMLKFLSITVPKEHTSHYETTLEARLPTPEVVGLQKPIYTDDTTTGKGWAFWEKFLGAAQQTGSTIGSILNDVNNPGSQQTAEQQAQAMQIQATEAKSSKTLYVIAGLFLAVIILIFAFKK